MDSHVLDIVNALHKKPPWMYKARQRGSQYQAYPMLYVLFNKSVLQIGSLFLSFSKPVVTCAVCGIAVCVLFY